ncbi:MAG: phosphatidylcholine/phosphatidylserine synthase [Phycisphaerae bacterium]|nr:phosphatidylcholine/phosphatidylserine synthase [Phycisphaerae bacterium]
MPLSAIAVHLFTATGAVCALLAALAILDGAYERMFVWLGVAFVVDAIDGTFARMVRVAERLPRFSGERLDLVIDYVTYVFIPALALLHAGYLPGIGGGVLAALMLLSALFHFSDTESKAADNSFIGFPAVWNLIAFYVFAFDLSPLGAAAVVVACVVLTFIPWRWVHPLRVASLRGVTLALSALWAAAAIWIVAGGFPAPLGPKLILLAVAAYTLALVVIRRGDPAAG